MRVWNCEDCTYYGNVKQDNLDLLTCSATLQEMQDKYEPCYVEYDDDIFSEWGD